MHNITDAHVTQTEVSTPLTPHRSGWRYYLMLFLYAIYLYFAYHILVIPAFAEFSYFALLVVPFMLFGFWLVPAERRKEIVVFTLLFLFLDQAIFNIITKIGPMLYIWFIFIGLFLFPIVRFYGKIRLPGLIIALALAITFNYVIPERLVVAYAHLYPKWSSEKLYIGSVTDSFAVAAVDIDGDGKSELVTLGNKDYYPDGLRKPIFSYKLIDEPLHLVVYSWRNGQLERVPNEQHAAEFNVTADGIRAMLPTDFINYPYYVLNDDLVLEPLVQRDTLTESMMQTGSAPFQAMRLNVAVLERLFAGNGYIYDRMARSGLFEDLQLKAGVLSGSYNGVPFAVESSATKIIGSIKLDGDKRQGAGLDGDKLDAAERQGAELDGAAEGLLVMGRDVHLWQMIDGQLQKTHLLTREMHNSLTLSRFMIDDLTGDGRDDLIVTYPTTSIVTPRENGQWDLIWRNDERGFDIKTIGRFKPQDELEIIALRKSAVRASYVNYLTSYSYDNHQLKQNWKVFLRNIDKVLLADVDGDGTNELITTMRGKHVLYVWNKHAIPVIPILISITLLLLLTLAGRRISDVRRKNNI